MHERIEEEVFMFDTSLIDSFNYGRTSVCGVYAISLATKFRPYYALWRLFPEEQPLFVRTLYVVFDTAVERAILMLQNCNVSLICSDNSEFESCYGRTDDIIPFGKYRGKRLAEIYYVEPSYVLWLANRFKPDSDRFDRLILLARLFSRVHFELTVHKNKISSVSHFVGEKGEKLKGLLLKVINVRIQVDCYKPDFYVDQNVLAVDRDGNRFVFLIKAGGKSLSPNELSCYSRIVSSGENIHILSAKVMSHYESRGVRYTRLGYVKLEK